MKPVLKPKVPYKKNREIYVWGRHAVEAILNDLQAREGGNPKDYCLHIIVDKSNKAPIQLKPLVDSAKTLGIKIISHSSAQDTWPLSDTEGINHQRAALQIPDYPVSDLSEAENLVSQESSTQSMGCVGLILDQIQDPRNFGAILRSASFFGVKFVIYATDRQSDLTGLVVKTSAGGAFSLKLIPVVNINRAMKSLKDKGAWIIGTALSDSAQLPSQIPKDRSYVLVLGNEQKGMRQEVQKNCDYLVKIPGGNAYVDSLNVSVAAGLLIHSLQADKPT